MKVAFIVRPNLYDIAGGDTVQIDQTANWLRKLGLEVDILFSNAVIFHDQYDVLNFFHITRSAAILLQTKSTDKPVVVSTIHCPYGDYDKYGALSVRRLFAAMSEDAKDYLRTTSRWLRGREGIPLNYIWTGQKHSINQVLKKADMLLPNSLSELNRIKERYDCPTPYAIVTNGINPDKFVYNPNEPKDEKLVISVGRIEKRKNQLNVIRALSNTDYKLVLIGASTPSQQSYYQQCLDAAGPNVKILNRIPHDEMVKYYQMAKVHVLASWFETTGLSSLEAAIMRCNLVITDKGDTRDYFGDDAFYCEPEDIESICSAVDLAIKAPINESLAEKILTEHTWQKAAEQTLAAYQSLL
ncbi:glycosyltransferase family 4 protein [Mucilaginibacter sp. dw_454]|uniref:glycosyltransferase family 4 protein n=1 Tax=Mucilaginibacter sp. dw_454 TaxID=2720079 RepID=UPI001BD65DB9|nr:glycosyltransferase family 4 protein [Mucilaginibacter sp. dw_454]